MHGARITVLYYFTAIYRSFPYSCTPCKPDSQLKIPTPKPLPRLPPSSLYQISEFCTTCQVLGTTYYYVYNRLATGCSDPYSLQLAVRVCETVLIS
eukprot:COSAG05_NODE_1370_length_5055_cov_1.930387_8_plen_96_part_00